MNKYSSYVSQIAKRQQTETMSRHMQGYDKNSFDKVISEIEREKMRKEHEQFFNFAAFRMRAVFRHENETFSNSSYEKQMINFIAEKLSDLNEFCLQDKEFSKSIANGTEYHKELLHFSDKTASFAEITEKGYSEKIYEHGWDDPFFKLDYFPSKKEEEPNIIRFTFQYLGDTGVVDICSDGEIIYKEATKKQPKYSYDDKGERHFEGYENVPCTVEKLLKSPSLNSKLFEYMRDFFMCIFEKAELKTEISGKHK